MFKEMHRLHNALRMRAYNQNVPESLTTELIEYATMGKEPSKYLRAILIGDLKTAFKDNNYKAENAQLGHTIQFINRCLHPKCWGDEETVEAWLDFLDTEDSEQRALAVYNQLFL